MTIRVALNHKTSYQFDRPVGMSPHEVRLRPAAHCRTPILSLFAESPARQAFHQLAAGPLRQLHRAAGVSRKPSTELEVTVDLVADMTVINPFDFFVEKYAEHFPFAYPEQLHKELVPFLETEEAGPRFACAVRRDQKRTAGRN